MIKQIRALYKESKASLPPFHPRAALARDKDLEGKTLPMTMYGVKYPYEEDDYRGRGEVYEVQVTRFGIDEGATAPTVTVNYRDGRREKCITGLFYLTFDDAQAEVNYYRALEARTKAKYQLGRALLDASPARCIPRHGE